MAKVIKYIWRAFSVFTVISVLTLAYFLGFPTLYELVQYSVMERMRFVSATQMEHYWGRKKFDRKLWDQKIDRHSQAIYLALSGSLGGVTHDGIIAYLGEPDGDYIGSESILTYRVIQGLHTMNEKIEGSQWSLVLFPDSAGRINKIKLYRGCCN